MLTALRPRQVLLYNPKTKLFIPTEDISTGKTKGAYIRAQGVSPVAPLPPSSRKNETDALSIALSILPCRSLRISRSISLLPFAPLPSQLGGVGIFSIDGDNIRNDLVTSLRVRRGPPLSQPSLLVSYPPLLADSLLPSLELARRPACDSTRAPSSPVG